MKSRKVTIFLTLFVLLFLGSIATYAQAPLDKTAEKALQILNKSIKKQPKNPDVYFERAEFYFENEYYEQALSDYEKSVELGLIATLSYTRIGYCHSRLKNQKEAIVNLSKAIEIDPNNTEAYGHRAYAYLIQRMPELAEVDYSHFLKTNPDDAIALFGLARAQEFQEKYEDALDNYTSALKNRNGFVEAQYRMGIVLGKLGDYLQAVEAISAAIDMNPDNGEFYYNRAIAKGKCKKEYCTDFKKALELGYPEAAAMHEKYCIKTEKSTKKSK